VALVLILAVDNLLGRWMPRQAQAGAPA